MRTTPLPRHFLEQVQQAQLNHNLTLTDWCGIKRLTGTPDGLGGSTSTWGYPTSKHRQVPCQVEVGGGTEQLVEGKLATVSPFTVDLPPGFDVVELDRIFTSQGIVLEILNVSSGVSEEICRKCTCVEIA